MNSDDNVDPLNLGFGRTSLSVVNHHGSPKEQYQATSNHYLAREVSDSNDEVVETSDNEELAFDLALQRPSYWLAPSLYPPFLQTTDSKPSRLSQPAIGPAAQPSTVRSVLCASRFNCICLSRPLVNHIVVS